MKFTFSYFLLIFLFICGYSGFSEGTKQMMPDAGNPTRILLDPSSGRVKFALYSSRSDTNYRLYIHIENPANERIYFGLGQQRSGTNNSTTESQITWRIHPPDLPNQVECSGLNPRRNNPPAVPSDVGYISTYLSDTLGPNVVNPAGYIPLICPPTNGAGDYFMTFEAVDQRTFDFFDISVVDISTTPPTVIPGRVFSRCWQIRNPSYGTNQYYKFKGSMFIYSNDRIVTRLNPNSMEGRDFAFSCNESGCYPIDGTHNAQAARQSQPGGPSPGQPHNYPQYKIFLNNPDQNIYPDGVIGRLVDGSVTTETFCDGGTVNFTFQTTPLNAIGSVEIILTLTGLTPSLTNRVLVTNNVPGGEYSISWDGKDGAGVQVPSGSTFPFTLRYTNGLTHMPLWDVEQNVNGFIVNLVRPVLVPPLDDPAFYWDDGLVNGDQVLNYPGCTASPTNFCHEWGGSTSHPGNWGDEKTINTWWYLVSNSTADVSITYKIGPSVMVPVNIPSGVCQGGSTVFTVAPDPNSQEYFWEWDGGSQTTSVPNITITFSTALPGPSIVKVNGINILCGAGPVKSIPFTINPSPVPTFSAGENDVCLNIPGNVYSTQSGKSNYTWTIPPQATKTSGGTATDNSVTVTWNTVGIYSILVNYTEPTSLCTGAVATAYSVNVKPLPVPSFTAGENAVCLNIPGQVYSTESGKSDYVWTIPPEAIKTAGGTASDNSVTLTWNTVGNSIISVNYTEPTTLCTAASATPYSINVKPLPAPSFISGENDVCMNVPGQVYTTEPGKSNYTWTFPPEATKIAGGTADDNSVTLTWTAVGTYVISVNYIEPTTLCEAASATLYPVNVKPLPEPSFIAGENAVCLNIPGHVYATESGKSNYIWNIPPEATKTAGGTATDNTVTLTWNTTGNQVLSVNYTEPATMCTAASATNYSVNVKPLPEPTFPTGENAVCLNIPGQVYSTESGKSDYVWTIPPEATKTAGGTASDNSVTLTWNTVGNSVISVNYTEPTTLCTAASATPYSVNVKPLPAPSFISGENDVCMNVPGQVYTTEPGKSNYTWTFPPEATKTAGGTVDDNSVTLTWTAVGRYDISVNYIEPTTLCTAASSTIYSVEVKPLPIPDISGPAIACVNTPGSKYYTQTGMSGYIWIVNGGTFTPGVTIDTINVIWTSTGSQHLTVNYTAMNGCTAATPAIFDVNVAVLPVPVITSGPGSICTDIATSYSTQAGMGEYEWIVSPNGAVTGANTDKIDVSWNSPGPKQVSVNYKMGPGCTGASPAIKSVTVNQSTPPVITSLLNPICLNSGTSYTTQSGMSNYNWTVSGGSFTTPTAGNSVSITWNTSGTQWVDVNFTNSDGCIAPFPSRYNVLVNPLPVTTITEGSGPTCNLQQHVYQTPPDPTCSFSWSAIPGTVVSPQGTNSATINWTSTGPATVSVMGTNTSTNCKSSSVYSTTVNPTPAPLFTPCFDLRTTPNANKITLRGGTPYLPVQGVYTGSRVTFNPVSGNYEFDPAGAAIGSYPIAYQYTNTFNCSASASSVTIQVVNSSLICGDSLTDVRDGTKYKTSLIGGRCWMQQNLRYGSTLLLTSEPQTDNCVSEKYCLPTDATCKSYGGLYQWDEVMSYSSTASNQGLCPPEWHVPSELEWQSMITDISAGITPPDGVAGSFLRDTFLNPGGFFALTKGLYYLSNSWAFTSGQLTGAMFWTATPDGADRSIARGVNSINLSTSKYSGSRNNAFSVRCVKD